MIDFKKFEKLSKTEYGVIRNLIVEEGLVENLKIEQIIEQVTKVSKKPEHEYLTLYWASECRKLKILNLLER